MDSANNTLRVATYNIRKCVGLDRRRDPGRVLDAINALEADVVALQEADRRLGRRPAALPALDIHRNSDMEAIEIAENDVSLGWHGNAVLVRKGTRVTGRERLTLPGLEPRGAVLAELDTGQRHVRVVAVHLGLTRKMRQVQLNEISTQIANRPDMPTIIMGDFNEWRAQLGVANIEQNYQVHSPGRSFHAARPIASLDKIVVSTGLTLADAGVSETKITQKASDHLPVWADFS